jgi:hypothetical protein
MIRAGWNQVPAISRDRAGGLIKIATKRGALAAVLLCAALWVGLAAAAQNASNSETFKGRLSPVPIDVTMMSRIAGSGSLTAVLAGKTLTLSGTFEGLRSPATTAQIRRAPKGIRGPAILDLTVSKAEKGTVNGSFELTPDQIADLKSERWYVQIQSERAPEGNLWGWLLH